MIATICCRVIATALFISALLPVATQAQGIKVTLAEVRVETCHVDCQRQTGRRAPKFTAAAGSVQTFSERSGDDIRSAPCALLNGQRKGPV